MEKLLTVLNQTQTNESRIPKSGGFLQPLIQDCACYLIFSLLFDKFNKWDS